MKKNNNTVKWMLGIMLILIPIAFWALSSSNTASSPEASGNPSPNHFFQFIGNVLGLRQQSPSSRAPSSGNTALNQVSPGSDKTIKSNETLSPSALLNKPVLGIATQETDLNTEQGSNSVQETNAENNLISNSEMNITNNPSSNSQISAETNAEISGENNPNNTSDSGSPSDNSGTNSDTGEGGLSTDNSGSPSGTTVKRNPGFDPCNPGCYLGCDPSCNPKCTPACLAEIGPGNSSGSGSGNGSGPASPSNTTVIVHIATDAEIAQNIAEQHQRESLLSALVANQQALTTKVRQTAEATKYQTVSAADIPPVDTTPAPQDLVDKIKSGQLIQH